MHNFRYEIAIVVALASVLWAADGRAQRVIRLTVGQSETIKVPGAITKVQVLNPSVADVATYSTQGATVVGMGPGATELHLSAGQRKFKFSIIVTGVELSDLFKQVRKFLGRIEGVYPRLIGDNVILSGHALTAEDYGRAQEAVQLFGNKVQNQVRFRKSAVQQVNQIFQQNGLGNVKFNLVSGALFLEGAVSSDQEMKKVEALLKTFGLNVENLLVVGGGRQILVDVQFVELRKSATTNVGLKWPGYVTLQGDNFGTLSGQIPIRPAGGQTSLSMSINTPMSIDSAALNLLFNSGYARLLAQPKLVCGSGKAAEFLVGGEIPIVTVTQTSVNVEWKEFGIKLKIKPTADSLGNVQSEIFAEVSEPDQSIEVMGVPGFRTRKFQTDVTVKDGSSIVLSGLFTNSEQKAVAKFPLLGHIPILGELFKSRDFQDLKTTLVVFVTPRVVQADHPWVQQTIKDIQRMYKDYEAEVGWQVFD